MKDFNQKQWDKSYKLRDTFIDIANNSLDNNLSKKNFDLYASNTHHIAIHHIEKGLLLWRVGQSPKAAFLDALESYKTFKQAVFDYSLKPNPVWVDRSISISLIAFLMDKDIPYGVNPDYEQWMAEAKKVDSGARDDQLRAMKYLCDIIKSKDTKAIPKLETELERLSTVAGFTLFVASYRSYLALLTCKDPNKMDDIVKVAEKNYLKRKKDKQMDVSIYGGGLYNPYMVDFILGAVLKKINWQGESRHKWLWS